MNINKTFAIATLTILATTACSKAERQKIGEYWSDSDTNHAHITCYSGGLKIYDGYSNGKVQNESSSDGYYFTDHFTGRLREVNGNCDIDYGVERVPRDFEPVNKPDGYKIVVKDLQPNQG